VGWEVLVEQFVLLLSLVLPQVFGFGDGVLQLRQFTPLGFPHNFINLNILQPSHPITPNKYVSPRNW
jgi:hypothetical protein